MNDLKNKIKEVLNDNFELNEQSKNELLDKIVDDPELDAAINNIIEDYICSNYNVKISMAVLKYSNIENLIPYFGQKVKIYEQNKKIKLVTMEGIEIYDMRIVAKLNNFEDARTEDVVFSDALHDIVFKKIKTNTVDSSLYGYLK